MYAQCVNWTDKRKGVLHCLDRMEVATGWCAGRKGKDISVTCREGWEVNPSLERGGFWGANHVAELGFPLGVLAVTGTAPNPGLPSSATPGQPSGGTGL